MITKELKALVKDEAQKLKKFALPKELERLDFSKIDPQHPHRCIYGQMARGCWSERAEELLNQCAQPFSIYISKYEKSLKQFFESDRGKDVFSPIEFYINQDGAKTESLINFLKGKSETLEL